MAHLAGIGRRDKASRQSKARNDVEQLEMTILSHSHFQSKPWERGKGYLDRWNLHTGADDTWPADISVHEFPAAKKPKPRSDPLAEYAQRLQYLYHELLVEHTELQADTYHRINMFQELVRRLQKRIDLLEKQVKDMLMSRADQRLKAISSVDELRELSNVLDYKVGQLLIPPSKRDRSTRRRGGTAHLHVPGLGGFVRDPSVSSPGMSDRPAVSPTGASAGTPSPAPRARRFSKTPRPPSTPLTPSMPKLTLGKSPGSSFNTSHTPVSSINATTPRTPRTPRTPVTDASGEGGDNSTVCEHCGGTPGTPVKEEDPFASPGAKLTPQGTPLVPSGVKLDESVETPLSSSMDDRMLFSQLLASRRENARLVQENFYLRNPDAPNAQDFLQWSMKQRDSGLAYDAVSWLNQLKALADREAEDDAKDGFGELTGVELELNRVRLLLERERSVTLDLRAKVFEYMGNENKLKRFLEDAITDVSEEHREAKQRSEALPKSANLVVDWSVDADKPTENQFERVDVASFTKAERRHALDVLLAREHVLQYIYTTFEKKNDPDKDPDGGMSINEAIGRDRTILQRMWDQYPIFYEDLYERRDDVPQVKTHKAPTDPTAEIEEQSFMSNLRRELSSFVGSDGVASNGSTRALDLMIDARERGASSAFGWGESVALDRFIREASEKMITAEKAREATKMIADDGNLDRLKDESIVRSRSVTIDDEQASFVPGRIRASRSLKRTNTSPSLSASAVAKQQQSFQQRKSSRISIASGASDQRPSTYREDTDGRKDPDSPTVPAIHRRLSVVSPNGKSPRAGKLSSQVLQAQTGPRSAPTPVSRDRSSSSPAHITSPRSGTRRNNGLPYVSSPLGARADRAESMESTSSIARNMTSSPVSMRSGTPPGKSPASPVLAPRPQRPSVSFDLTASKPRRSRTVQSKKGKKRRSVKKK